MQRAKKEVQKYTNLDFNRQKEKEKYFWLGFSVSFLLVIIGTIIGVYINNWLAYIGLF